MTAPAQKSILNIGQICLRVYPVRKKASNGLYDIRNLSYELVTLYTPGLVLLLCVSDSDGKIRS